MTRDGDIILQGITKEQEIIVSDTSAEPSSPYSYQAYRTLIGTIKDSSEVINLTMMDTTSFDFEWEEPIFFGGGVAKSYSILNDVQIVNENNIWVVGRYYDSETGVFYNAVHWDGVTWTKKHFIDKLDYSHYISDDEIKGIRYFDDKHIWFLYVAGGAPAFFDGDSLKVYSDKQISRTSLYCMWGNTPDNMYFGGYQGNLLHWDGIQFKKIETGIETDILSLDGTEENILYLTGYDNGLLGHESVFLRVENQTSEILNEIPSYIPGSPEFLFQIDIIDNKPYFLSSMGMSTYGTYRNIIIGEFNFNTLYELSGFWRQLRGKSKNDIILMSPLTVAYHFNGKHWKVIRRDNSRTTLMRKLAYKDGIIVAVGWHDATNQTSILVGRKCGE